MSKTKAETSPVSKTAYNQKGWTMQIKKMNQQLSSSVTERDINKYTSPNTVTKYLLRY
jgi:hypothetical protein